MDLDAVAAPRPLHGSGTTGVQNPGSSRQADAAMLPEDVVAAGVLLDVSRVLGGLLGLARPAVGARTEQVTRLVRQVTRAMDLAGAWEFEVAARLSQIGWLTLSAETSAAAWRGEPLPDDQWFAVLSHPLAARDLLSEVRRLDGVREMIARQGEPFSVAGELPVPLERRDRLMLGGHLLRVCTDYVALVDRGVAPADALGRLGAQSLEYDPEIVAALTACLQENARIRTDVAV